MSVKWESRSNLPPLVKLVTHDGMPVIVNMAHVVVVKEAYEENSTEKRTDLFFMDGKQMQVRQTVQVIWDGVNRG